MFTKAINSVKQKVTRSGVPKFKPLKESQVEESALIPKVQPQKDFKEYFRKLKTADVATYH